MTQQGSQKGLQSKNFWEEEKPLNGYGRKVYFAAYLLLRVSTSRSATMLCDAYMKFSGVCLDLHLLFFAVALERLQIPRRKFQIVALLLLVG